MAVHATIEVPEATYRLVGGDPVFDFANTASWFRVPTRAARDYVDHIGKERLVVPQDIERWGRVAGVLTSTDREAPLSRQALLRARALRHAIYRLFKGTIEGWPALAADLAALDVELAAARANERLHTRGNEFVWEWRTRPSSADAVLWTVARRAADLLTSDRLGAVRQCGGDDCGWLFLDTTRNHSRRWCEMADCGNLAKVRRFRGRDH